MPKLQTASWEGMAATSHTGADSQLFWIFDRVRAVLGCGTGAVVIAGYRYFFRFLSSLCAGLAQGKRSPHPVRVDPSAIALSPAKTQTTSNRPKP